MDQKELWNRKWRNAAELDNSPTRFAKKVFKQIPHPKGKRLLDLGCGQGDDSVYFASKGLHVVAVDFAEEAVSRMREHLTAKKINNIKIVVKDVLTFRTTKKFDVIYANLILHYFDHKTTVKVFDKLYRMLNKGGYFFVRCKSVKDGLHKLGKEIEPDVRIIKGKQQHLFSKKYMEKCLERFNSVSVKAVHANHRVMEGGFKKAYFTEGFAIK